MFMSFSAHIDSEDARLLVVWPPFHPRHGLGEQLLVLPCPDFCQSSSNNDGVFIFEPMPKLSADL